MAEHTISSQVEKAAAAAVVPAPRPDQVDDQELIKSLEIVNPQIRAKEPVWLDIDDVLDKTLTRRSHEEKTLERVPMPKPDGIGMDFHFRATTQQEFEHLPRGSLEPWSEYAKRVRLTPFFPETPRIVASRRGVMFANEPKLDVNKDVRPFLQNIGPRKQTYSELLDLLSTRILSYAIAAVLVDFRPLPDDVRERVKNGEAISEGEVENRNLNKPVLGIFREREILDFEYDSVDGRLKWMKFREMHLEREDGNGWMTKGRTVKVFKIVDRMNITRYDVKPNDNGVEEITSVTVMAHGAQDINGEPEVPVVFINPFGTPRDLGDPPIQLSVEADLAAARVGSDVHWNLYVHGNPQLVFATDDPDDDDRMVTIGLGVNRYVAIRTANQARQQEAENLSYLQLDATGLEILMEMQEKLRAKANELASNTTPNATTEPVSMSGVAKAWDFKTGEEKTLHELVMSMEKASDEILKMVTRQLSRKGMVKGEIKKLEDEVRTSLEPSFDIADPQVNLELVEQIIDIAKAAKLTEMEAAALKRTIKSLPGLSEEEQKKIEKEIVDMIRERQKEVKEAADKPPVLAPPGAPGEAAKPSVAEVLKEMAATAGASEEAKPELVEVEA